MCWLRQSAQMWYYPRFILIIIIALGLIECLAGYRAWKFLLGFNGLFLGAVAGGFLSLMSGLWVMIVLAILGGAIGLAMVFVCVLPVGSFVFALLSSVTLFLTISHLTGLVSNLWLVMAVAAALASAVAAAVGYRPVMIAIAAICGAQQVAGSITAYILPYEQAPALNSIEFRELATFAGLAMAGLCIQFLTTRKPGSVPRPAISAQAMQTDAAKSSS